MAKRDYYEILGVGKDSDERTIKKAYRKLARKHHPDASSESPEIAEKKFKEISEAYEVLADEEKRSRYDRFGHKGVDFDGGGFSLRDKQNVMCIYYILLMAAFSYKNSNTMGELGYFLNVECLFTLKARLC